MNIDSPWYQILIIYISAVIFSILALYSQKEIFVLLSLFFIVLTLVYLGIMIFLEGDYN